MTTTTKTEQDILALRQVTREAHEAAKEARQVIADLTKLRADVKKEFNSIFSIYATQIIKEGLEAYKTVIDKQIQAATERVFQRFENLADLFLGETKTKLRDGQDLATLLHKRKIAERRVREAFEKP